MLNKENHYTYLRKELLCRFLNFLFDGDSPLEINKIPYDMIPSGGDPRRCCIYKDREMIKYRLLALMGYDLSDDLDESFSLFQSFSRVESDKAPSVPPLSVIKAACSSCRSSRYRVTELCRGCLARPCQTVCPANALTMAKGKAIIDSEKCINCGKCRKSCPYSAIVYIPVPCEEVCPVGAIIQKDGHSIEIDRAKCISCGRCTRSCPFGAIVEKSHILPLVGHIKNKNPMTLLIAPSLYDQLPGSDSQILEALKALGFSRIVELKEAAQLVALREGEEWLERKENGEPFMTTSCCPAYVEAVRKHMPLMEKHISETPSPMILGARLEKENYPENLVVFAGPCIAKKNEAGSCPDIDFIINFEELGALLMSREIEINDYPSTSREEKHALGRGFASAGGVATAVKSLTREEVGTMNINGLTGKMIRLMNTWTKRPPEADLVEVMACEGGCDMGPCSLNS